MYCVYKESSHSNVKINVPQSWKSTNFGQNAQNRPDCKLQYAILTTCWLSTETCNNISSLRQRNLAPSSFSVSLYLCHLHRCNLTWRTQVLHSLLYPGDCLTDCGVCCNNTISCPWQKFTKTFDLFQHLASCLPRILRHHIRSTAPTWRRFQNSEFHHFKKIIQTIKF